MRAEDRTHGRIVRGLAWAAALNLMMASSGFAAEEGVPAAAWQGTAYHGATVTSGAGGSIVVGFPNPSSPPKPSQVELVAGGSPMSSVFAGDYTAAGVQGLKFKLKSTLAGGKYTANVILRGTSGRVWLNAGVTISADADTVAESAISLKRTAGWVNNNKGDKDALWADDVQSVYLVGVSIKPADGAPKQSVTVSDFVLVGDGFSTGAAQLTALQQALESRFGVSSIDDLSAAQLAQDSDGDGMTDLDEILAGTDPDDKNSVFNAEIVSVTAAGVTIKWPSVEGASYTVSRSASLTGTFGALATDIVGGTYTDKTAGAGPYFYKIMKQD